MYITYVPNRNSPPAVLLRESYRESGTVKSRTLATLANLSKLPAEVHSFRTLLGRLSALVRNVYLARGSGPDAPTFDVVTTPDAKQQRAYEYSRPSDCRQRARLEFAYLLELT